jgi:hypothetical protein
MWRHAAAEGGANWVSRTDSFVMPEAVAKGELHPLRNPAGDPELKLLQQPARILTTKQTCPTLHIALTYQCANHIKRKPLLRPFR